MRTGNFIRPRISSIVRFLHIYFLLAGINRLIILTYRFNISFDLKSFFVESFEISFSVFEMGKIGEIGEMEEISGFFDGFNFEIGSFVFGSFD